MKQLIKQLISRTPYRITRSGALNRFDAAAEALASLRARGFHPTRIIDGGANIGAFARTAHRTFPSAAVDLIEPQPACSAILRAFSSSHGFTLHEVALVAPAAAGKPVALRISPDEVSTGAHIATEATAGTVAVPTSTLDELLEGRIGANDRLLLKLDLQGYELEALRGAQRTLPVTEVILTEVSFFAQAFEPPIATLIGWLDDLDFSLYDIAALSGRARDGRARQGDFIFVRRSSALMRDGSWD